MSPVGDGAVFVDAMAMTALNSSNVISLSKIVSMSVQSCGICGTCEIPFHILSKASSDILVVICVTVVLKYSLSVRNLSCSFYSIICMK